MTNSARPGSQRRDRILSVRADGSERRVDHIATEEPLEIRLSAGGVSRRVAITMRTPGSDFELAAGFLYGEGVVASAGDIRRISYCVDRALDESQRFNVVNVELADGCEPDVRGLERHFYTSSACGVCGKASLDALRVRGHGVPDEGWSVSTETLFRLPGELRKAQGLFEATGGLHAAGVFAEDGELLGLREDVGRHNAVDKLVGRALLAGGLPLERRLLLVSGRTSFEILQKAVAAGAPIVCAVSAPSTLAIDVARAFGVTLVGFLREGRFNVYCGEERVRAQKAAVAAKATGPGSR